MEQIFKDFKHFSAVRMVPEMTDGNVLTDLACNLGIAEDNGLLLSNPYGAKC